MSEETKRNTVQNTEAWFLKKNFIYWLANLKVHHSYTANLKSECVGILVVHKQYNKKRTNGMKCTHVHEYITCLPNTKALQL